SRAEHDGRPVVVDELPEGGQGRREQRNRQGLGLVEDDHALRQTVQLSAPGSPAREERLEELNVGRDDERRVKVLCREPCAAGLARRVVRLETAVVLEKFVAEISERLAENVGGLLDDAREWNGVDDASLVVFNGVSQPESQGGEGLAASRGDVEREEAGGQLGLLAAASQHLTSLAIHRCVVGIPLLLFE